MRKLHFARFALLSMLMMLTALPVGAQQYVSDIYVLQSDARPPTESSTLSPNLFEASLPDTMRSGNSYRIKISNMQSNGAVTYKSSDKTIALVVDKTGWVYAKKAGDVVITVKQAASAEYEAREVKINCVIHPSGIVEFRDDSSIWYAISTFDQLNTYRGTQHANLYLKKDIDAFATKDKWNSVDNTMIFDGNGHNVYNAKFPLFYNNTGTIKNLKMTNADITDNDHLYTGIVCCKNEGTISNVWVEGSVNNSSISSDGVRCGSAGGICGLNESTISNCLNKASVAAVGRLGPVTVGRIGGICARNTGIISYCSSVGALTFKDRLDNGISGGGTITNCYYLQGTLKEADGTEYNSMNSMSAAAYASGEVTWLLNNKKNGEDGAWRQYYTATVKEPRLAYFDSLPQMKPVYSGFKVNSCKRVYAFTSVRLADKPSPHIYNIKTGVCMVCQDYQRATKNSDGYYEIYNPGQLAWLSQQVRANENDYNAILMNDIDLSSVCSKTLGSWMPIGSFTDFYYRGTFNGNGYTIKNLYIANNEAYQGLFGYNCFGTIKNFRVYGTVSASKNVGMVCGKNEGYILSCISGSTTGGGTVSAKKNAGGIAGYNYTVVRNCLNLATVSADEIAGGIAGYNEGRLKSCMNNVTKNSAGYVGLNDRQFGHIFDCYFYNQATADRDFTNWTLLAKLGKGWAQLYRKDGEDWTKAMETLLPTDMSREFRSLPNFAYSDGDVFNDFKCEKLQLSDNMVIPFPLLVKTANYTRKVPSTGSKWGTLCLPFDIMSAKNDPTIGLEAYDGFELSGSSLRLTSGPGKKIPAGTPVIVKTQDGSINYTINYESTRADGYYQLVDKPLKSTATGDKLVGVFEPTKLDVTQAADGHFYYYLNSDKF